MAKKIKYNILSCVKSWYLVQFQSDELGVQLNWITFEKVYFALLQGKEIYNVLGPQDSIVRERVFQKLSEILNVDYNHIYNLWLKTPKESLITKN